MYHLFFLLIFPANVARSAEACNIYLELWVLLLALYFLWFSSDDYLELNLKLAYCTIQLFTYLTGGPPYYYAHHEKIKFMALIIINFFYMMMIYSVLPIPMFYFVQAGLLHNLLVFVQNSLHLHLYGTKLIKHDGRLIPLVIGNHNQFCFYLVFKIDG